MPFIAVVEVLMLAVTGCFSIIQNHKRAYTAKDFASLAHQTRFHFSEYRFMGMKAAILTNNSSLKSFSAKLGFSVLQFDELVEGHSTELQHNVVALELLKLLGFQEGKVLDSNHFDLVFFHIGAGEQKVVAADVEYMDALVGGIMSQAQLGSDISSRLHLSVVMSYGNVLDGDDSKFSVLKRVDEKKTHLSLLYPLQSYAMKGGIPRKDVR
uniref:Uncharacterized protein n=1 Tax=Cajanus cajan TaxID=3821 RepID=A0A151TYW2_CAJCA|nr:hypothetical protein KK1_004847 [Cajanus cajan]